MLHIITIERRLLKYGCLDIALRNDRRVSRPRFLEPQKCNQRSNIMGQLDKDAQFDKGGQMCNKNNVLADKIALRHYD